MEIHRFLLGWKILEYILLCINTSHVIRQKILCSWVCTFILTLARTLHGLTRQHTSLSTDYVNNYIDFDLLPYKLSVPDEYTFHASNLFVYPVPFLSETLNLDFNVNIFLVICRSFQYYKTWATYKENVRLMETLVQCTSHYQITLTLWNAIQSNWKGQERWGTQV